MATIVEQPDVVSKRLKKIEDSLAKLTPDAITKSDLRFIGLSLREIRNDKKVSQQKLSILSGISKSELSRIEHGSLIPNYSKVMLICQSLEIDLFAFIVKCLDDAEQSDNRTKLTINEIQTISKEVKQKINLKRRLVLNPILPNNIQLKTI